MLMEKEKEKEKRSKKQGVDITSRWMLKQKTKTSFGELRKT